MEKLRITQQSFQSLGTLTLYYFLLTGAYGLSLTRTNFSGIRNQPAVRTTIATDTLLDVSCKRRLDLNRVQSLKSLLTSQNELKDRRRSNRVMSVTLYSNIANENDNVENEEAKKRIRDEVFWAKQRALAAEMTAKSDSVLRRQQQQKFAKRRLALSSDTFYFSILIASLLWLLFSNPFVSLSYLFGAMSGTAYSYGLGKYVETIGGSIDDTEVEGVGVGQARFAFLILLFVVVGKFREYGLLEIPSIMGFFTYQLASLSQGLRDIDD